MAFGVRLSGFDVGGDELWQMTLDWWNDSELRREVPLRNVSEDAGYQDFEETVSRENALQWSARYAPHVQPHMRREAEELETRLLHLPADVSLRLRIYEWESGM